MPSKTRSYPAIVLFVLGLIQAIWPLTMDLYLPALPLIGRDLASSSNIVQLTLTGAFMGMAIGQLLAGPVSDRIGRVKPLVIVLVIYTLATVACSLAPSIETLIAARFIQGFGASASSVIVSAMVRDMSSGALMVRLIARLQLVNGVFVVASPAIGAQLLAFLDWRGLFWILVVYGSLLLIATISVLVRFETNPPEKRALRDGAGLRDDYRVLLADKKYLAAVAVGGLLWAAMMSYMASSAFLFTELYGLDATAYAIIFGAHGALMIAGAQLSARLVPRFGVERIMVLGLTGAAISAIALVVSVTVAPDAGLLPFVVPLFFFTTSFGFVSPSIQSAALENHATRAGTASSLLGATSMVLGSLAVPFVGAFGTETPAPVTIAMLACAAAALTVANVAFRKRRGVYP